MVYSYTQISQYLTCPRRYRHRYLDGWQEKDTRAAMLFGRAFERALAAYFLRQDAAAALFQEWKLCQDQKLEYSHGDTWDRMFEQGIQLLERFCQEDRVRIRQPRRNLQVKFVRPLSGQNEFVAYVDALGRLDDRGALLEWKTTSSRFPEQPDGLLALDPQLICYSWITGVSEVAQVVFVRKRLVEIQYLHTTITDEQRRELGQLVETTILEKRFPESRRKAYYLMSIHEHLPAHVRRELKQVGWTKGLELAKLARRDGQEFDCAIWLHKARVLPKDEFRREVEKELTGKETEPWEIVYFKLYKSQIPVIEQALETAALMLGSDRSRGYCLEMICADFLAGANLDSGDPNVLLRALSSSFKFLPENQRQAFLQIVNEQTQ